MVVVPKPHEWDMIPYMAGTLVYERKSELQEVPFFLFFRSIKTISDWYGVVKREMCRFLQHVLLDSIRNLRF